MGLSVYGSFTSFAPLTRRVCTSGLNGSSNLCDKAIELVTLVSSDLVMQLTLRSHGDITAIGGIGCKSHCEANSLHLGAGILMSTLLKRTPVWVFLPQITTRGVSCCLIFLLRRRTPMSIRWTDMQLDLQSISCPKQNDRRCMVASPARMKPTRYSIKSPRLFHFQSEPIVLNKYDI